MFRDFAGGEISRGMGATRVEPIHLRQGDWTVLIPFFNERDHLAGTIGSLAAQTEPFLLVLIDNGSTDGGAAVARAVCQRLGINYLLLEERMPGKVSALATGLRYARTPYVATCDADTWYPADYLAKAGRLLARRGVVAAGAYFAQPHAPTHRRWAKALTTNTLAVLAPKQCHTGGAGQVFRTASLRRAGGFDPQRWNYVLEDHEITCRVQRRGRMAYDLDFWCAPSPRPRDRASVKWTRVEQLGYQLSAPVAGRWYFENVLGPRLAKRRLTSERLRETAFQHVPATRDEKENAHGAAYSLCG